MTRAVSRGLCGGQTYGSCRFQIERSGSRAFASEFDPHPFHLDAAAAQHTYFRLVAAVWHTAAVDHAPPGRSELRPVAGSSGPASMICAGPRPVRPGAELNIAEPKFSRSAIEVRFRTSGDQGGG